MSNSSHPPNDTRVVLRAENISKSFGPVQALRDVSFEVREGETLAIVGNNGAGKSTLAKIITGVFAPTSGSLFVDERPAAFRSPSEAHRRGIEAVYQDLALVSSLDAAENFFLRRELVRVRWLGPFAFVRKREMRRCASRAISDLHVQIPGIATKSIAHMSGGQRQAVAIARAAYWAKRVLILDEPTAALGVHEADMVLQLLNQIKEEKRISMLVISHNLEHVWAVCDRILVLRQSQQVALLDRNRTTPRDVVEHITGAQNALEARISPR
jgi:ABC-type sugar transport system ATPase subunit